MSPFALLPVYLFWLELQRFASPHSTHVQCLLVSSECLWWVCRLLAHGVWNAASSMIDQANFTNAGPMSWWCYQAVYALAAAADCDSCINQDVGVFGTEVVVTVTFGASACLPLGAGLCAQVRIWKSQLAPQMTSTWAHWVVHRATSR